MILVGILYPISIQGIHTIQCDAHTAAAAAGEQQKSGAAASSMQHAQQSTQHAAQQIAHKPTKNCIRPQHVSIWDTSSTVRAAARICSEKNYEVLYFPIWNRLGRRDE